MRIKKQSFTFTFVMLAGCAAALAHAGAMGAVKERMDAMSDMGRALKPLFLEMRAGTLMESAEVETHIEVLRRNADILPSLFADHEMSEVSEALETIWTEPQAFEDQVLAFQTQIAAFVQAYEQNDKAAAKNALRAVSSQCASCHQKFRESQRTASAAHARP